MANRILDTLLNALEWHDAIVRLLGTAEIVVVQAIVFTVGVAVQEEVLAVGDIKAVQDVQLIVQGGRGRAARAEGMMQALYCHAWGHLRIVEPLSPGSGREPQRDGHSQLEASHEAPPLDSF